jgi:hypothetical protein
MSTAAVIVIVVALAIIAFIVTMARRAATRRGLEDTQTKAVHDDDDFHRSHAEASRQEADPAEEAVDPDPDPDQPEA